MAQRAAQTLAQESDEFRRAGASRPSTSEPEASSRSAAQSTATPSGAPSWPWDGTHKLPIKAALRKAISKHAGDTVSIRLEQQLDD